MPGEDVKIETEIKTNDQGQKVEITRKIKIKKVLMTPAMLARRDWKKFGDCANLKKGPDSKSTTIGEAVFLDLSSNSKDLDKEEEEADAKAKMDQKSKIVCRNCKGDHWTPKCPYKNNLSEEKPESKGVAEKPGKYVAPSKRSGATPSSAESMQDNLTVRISNLSSDVTDKDIRDLVSRIGMVTRTYLAKDMQTGLAKGYAFVTFMDRSGAAECVRKLDGHPYDSLILRAEIAVRNKPM